MRLPWCGGPRDGTVAEAGRGGRWRPGRPTSRANLGGRGLDDLVEGELAAFDAVSAVVRQRRVAVLVDRVGAQDGLPVLDLVERVDHGLLVVALVTGVGDGLQG